MARCIASVQRLHSEQTSTSPGRIRSHNGHRIHQVCWLCCVLLLWKIFSLGFYANVCSLILKTIWKFLPCDVQTTTVTVDCAVYATHQWILFITTSMDDHGEEQRTERNLFVRSSKSEAEVTTCSYRRLRLMYCTIEANYWQTCDIAWPLCNSRAACLLYSYVILLNHMPSISLVGVKLQQITLQRIVVWQWLGNCDCTAQSNCCLPCDYWLSALLSFCLFCLSNFVLCPCNVFDMIVSP